jgi:uncharacterized membrane protein YoaK (UPF0700 family)
MLAGLLALVAGYVNSGGFVIIGSFTSHVTGSVGRLSNDLATGQSAAAVFAFLLIASFFVGAVVATLLVEGIAGPLSRGYGFALLVEGGLLAGFVAISGLSSASQSRILDLQAAVLCAAMGVQNSLVTRLSGSVIRTTHLTGVVTDLGIETARWYRWHRAKLKGLPVLLPGRVAPERPAITRSVLLLVIFGAFVVGAVLGASLTINISRWALGLPAIVILGLGIFALRNHSGSEHRDETT